ncbi:BNR repeat domain protein [Escherichia phage EJP2]|nr:BNR repeat domain protein [Escherichia phage EJP2]
MLPFARILEYSNVAPTNDDRFKIYSSMSVYLHDTFTKKLYASSGSIYGTGTGVAASKFILCAENVKRVLLEDNSSDCQLYEEEGTGKVFMTGNTNAFTGVTDRKTLWTDCTTWITSSGITVSDIAYMSSFNNMKVNLVTNDGTLYCCGANNISNITSFGDGTNISSFNTFKKVSTITSVKKAVGNIYLRTDNTLWGCGFNYYYQLGTGDQVSITGVKQIASDVIDFNVSYQSTFFIKSDGNLYGCGKQYGAQYGNEFGTGGTSSSTDLQYKTPTLLSTGVSAVYTCVSNMASHIVKADEVLYASGGNGYGKLGVGNTINQYYYTPSYTSFNTSCNLVTTPSGTLLLDDKGKLYYCGIAMVAMGGLSTQSVPSYTEVDMSFVQ